MWRILENTMAGKHCSYSGPLWGEPTCYGYSPYTEAQCVCVCVCVGGGGGGSFWRDSQVDADSRRYGVHVTSFQYHRGIARSLDQWLWCVYALLMRIINDFGNVFFSRQSVPLSQTYFNLSFGQLCPRRTWVYTILQHEVKLTKAHQDDYEQVSRLYALYFSWSAHPYPSKLLHWHCLPSNEATLEHMGKWLTWPHQGLIT